jgi:uncharacterized protein
MPTQAALPNAAAPTAAKDRIGAIDIVRGVALYGVMAINVVTEFRVSHRKVWETLLRRRCWPNRVDIRVTRVPNTIAT